MKIMERLVTTINRGTWEELEWIELQYETLERQWGFPPSRRYRPGASGQVMNTLITEREWESYAAREAAYEKALVDPAWIALGEQARRIATSIQSEFYHPLEWPSKASRTEANLDEV